MRKIKDLFEKFLFTVEEVEEVVEDEPVKPEPVVVKKEEKPQPVKKSRTPVIEKPVVRKRNTPSVREVEEYEPSPMINLTKEIKIPKLGDENTAEMEKVDDKPVEKKEPEKIPETNKPAAPAKKTEKIEPELPQIKPVRKPEKKDEPFTSTAIISPMFGKQEKETKPVKKKRREIVMPESEMGEKKSIIGTVFSPLYGDKNDALPADEVDPAIANLSVSDFINEKKEENVEPVKPEPIVEEPEVIEEQPVEEPVTQEEEPVDEIEELKPETMTAEELRRNASVTPFGNVTVAKPEEKKVSIHDVWNAKGEETAEKVKAVEPKETVADEKKEQVKEEERYENISLFDFDDKM